MHCLEVIRMFIRVRMYDVYNIHSRLGTEQSELGQDLNSMCSLSFLLLVSDCGRTFLLLDSLPSYALLWYLSIDIAITSG